MTEEITYEMVKQVADLMDKHEAPMPKLFIINRQTAEQYNIRDGEKRNGVIFRIV